MADKLVNELMDITDKEIELQKTLLKSAEKQTKLLVKNKFDRVMQNAQVMEQIVVKVRKLEKRTREILNILLSGTENEELSVSKLIEDDSVEKKIKNELGKKLGQMADIIRKLTLTNYRNALLIKQLMDVQSFEAKLLVSGLNENIIYGEKGKVKSANDNLFLDKQI